MGPEDWLSKIERGEWQAQRLDVLTDLARELRVTHGDLLGQPVLAEDDDVPAVRDGLMAPRRLSRVHYRDERGQGAVPPVVVLDVLYGMAAQQVPERCEKQGYVLIKKQPHAATAYAAIGVPVFRATSSASLVAPSTSVAVTDG